MLAALWGFTEAQNSFSTKHDSIYELSTAKLGKKSRTHTMKHTQKLMPGIWTPLEIARTHTHTKHPE